MNQKNEIKVMCTVKDSLPISELRELQGNLKKITPQNLKKLKESIISYGISFPFFIYHEPKENINYTIDGHQRMVALKSLQNDGFALPRLPIVYIDALSINDAKERILIACSMYGSYDSEGLKTFASEIKNKDKISKLVDLAGINLDRVFALLKEKSDPEIIPVIEPKTPITRVGDIWIMGEHRLICGDATKPETVDNLFAGKKPMIMVSDPPYGVEYDATWRSEVDGCTERKSGKVANDHQADWTEAYKLFTGNVIYLWHAGIHTLTVAQNLIESGFDIRSEIIWVKQNLVLSRGHYHWMHEPAFYAVRKGSTADWTGDRKQTTVWEIPNSNPFAGKKDDQNTIHSTQKPLQCYEKPIRNHGMAGDIIYDPFCGSGTLFIACERENRIGYGCEILPEYCDIIIKRWCDYTGKDAIRYNDGKSWNQLSNLNYGGSYEIN